MTTIDSVTPALGSVGQDVVLEITGSGFLVTSTARLETTILPPTRYSLINLQFISSTLLRGTAPANSVPLGFYNVVVDNGGGDTATMPLGYRVSVDLPTRPFLQNNTTDDVQARILSRIGNAPSGLPYDKRKGQIVWDMTATHGPEYERVYKRLDDLLPQGFAQFMGGALLDLRAEEHGVLRNPASFATTIVETTAPPGTIIPTSLRGSTTATPNSGEQPILFNSTEIASITQKASVTGNVTSATASTLVDNTKAWVVDSWVGYTVLITLGFGLRQWRKIISNTATTLGVADWDTGATPNATSQYKIFTGVEVQAEVAGKRGNVLAGAINKLVTPITFVTAISNPVAATGGLDRESDRLFLGRFLIETRTKSRGGNDVDYEIWARETPGVSLGAVSVLAEWNGYGTVKVVIINADNSIPDASIVGKVYAYIQTKRPIGADVTVQSATPANIEARFTLTAKVGYSLASVQQVARQAIISYLNSITVGGEEGLILFYRVQQAALDNTEGIETFDMYSAGYGIRRAGAPAYGTVNIAVLGTEKPVAGAVTVV